MTSVLLKLVLDFVKKELSSLKIKKSSGLKNIHTRFLKTGADVLAELLTYIYNLSLRTVTPLHKSGSLSDPSNFRPIAGVPAVMKIFERAIHKQIYKHLTTHKLLSTHQSGFPPGHSTATCLLDVSDFILKNMDKGLLTGGIFLDLSEAFDLIDHTILKTKLKSIGIRGCTFNWFEDYLSGRTHTVCINGSNSEEMSMRRGVQQGSVLGRLLFLIFINDLPNSTKHCKIVLYADDTAIFFAHKDVHTIQSTFQQDLNALNNWFYDNGLIVNCSKTNILLFGTNKRLVNVNNLTLKLDETTISHNIASIKYLGLIMDSNLNWHDHIDYIASKVSSRLGLLGRIRKYISVDTCKQLHCSLQPLYEYCTVVWSNADKTHLQRLLRLQKRGARLILKRRTNDCRSSALFKELGWVNLTDRWTSHKCETVYRCLNHFYPSYLSNLFCLNSDVHNYNTRRKNDIHLAKIGSKSGERSFTYKAAKLFNNLSSTTKSAKSVTSFTNLYWRDMKQYV